MYFAKLFHSSKKVLESMSECEGRTVNREFKKRCKYDYNGKGMLLCDSSYLSPLSAQCFSPIYISLCLLFPLGSVGEQFLRTGKQNSKSIVPLGCINFRRCDASVSQLWLGRIKPACFCYSDTSVIQSQKKLYRAFASEKY